MGLREWLLKCSYHIPLMGISFLTSVFSHVLKDSYCVSGHQHLMTWPSLRCMPSVYWFISAHWIMDVVQRELYHVPSIVFLSC